MGTHRRAAVLVAALLLAGALGWRARRAPLVADEVEFVQTGPALVRGEGPVACGGEGPETVLHHPQAYHALLGVVLAAWGGPDPLAARLPGILSLLLSLPLAAALARRLAPPGRTEVGTLAAALLATSPLALQSALTVDIDTTILVPAMTAFMLLLARRVVRDDGARLRPRVLGLAFAGLLWIKLPTPFLATSALALGGVLGPGRRRPLRDALVITVIGVAAFAASWIAFCGVASLDPAAPLVHLAGRGAAHASLSAAVLAKRALRLGLWLGPWLPIGVALAAVGHPGAEAAAPVRRLIVAFVMLGAIGYLFVGGEAFGFPRYHAPLLPAAAALAAAGAGRLTPRAWAAGAVVLAYCVVFVGDPLLPAYTFAEAVAAGDQAPSAITGVALRGALWLVPALALPLAPRLGVSARGLLAVLALATGLATFAVQLPAGYATTYLYGERGLTAARARVARADSSRQVLAPKDVAFPALPCGRYLFAGRALSRGALPSLLEADALSLVVLRRGDLVDATVAPALRDPRVGPLLAARFRRERIGDFFLYERRPEAP